MQRIFKSAKCSPTAYTSNNIYFPLSHTAIVRRIISTTILIGGCCFITDPSTWVGKSTFFKALFSRQWGDKQDNGSFFVDADADLFKHILRYLRRGLLPVFYNRVNGHNHVLYSALLEEARFFGIDRPEEWLSEKKYLEAVKIVYLVAETDNFNKLATTVNSDVEIVYHPAWKKVRVYYYPDEENYVWGSGNVFMIQNSASKLVDETCARCRFS
jgi:BTB/POZ domain